MRCSVAAANWGDNAVTCRPFDVFQHCQFNALTIYPSLRRPSGQSPGMEGFEVRRSDINRGPLHDLTSSQGFLLAMKGVLRLKENGLLWLGVPCNSTLGLNLGHASLYMISHPVFCTRGRRADLTSWSSNKVDLDFILHHKKNDFGLWNHG